MIEINTKTMRAIEAIFLNSSHREIVKNLLEKKCSDNIPFCENHSSDQMERIRFSVLKLSQGDLDKLQDAINLAVLDWRDLFMAAEFGHDIEAHEEWYNSIINS